jgi:hypothetical protein
MRINGEVFKAPSDLPFVLRVSLKGFTPHVVLAPLTKRNYRDTRDSTTFQLKRNVIMIGIVFCPLSRNTKLSFRVDSKACFEPRQLWHLPVR